MRRAYVLAAITWGYLAWSLLPLAVTLAISLGWDPLTGQGELNVLAYRLALRGSGVRRAFIHSVWLAVGTVLVAVPMGTALGLVLGHMTSRPWRVVKVALIGMIALPHLALGVVLFYAFIFVVHVQLNTVTQLIGHVTVALPFVALIVWIRMLFIDETYEDQAADLGAPPLSTLTRVLLPLCLPSIVVAATVAFAVSFNELTLSRYLCTPRDCRTIPMLLGGPEDVEVSPPLVAMGFIGMGVSVALLLLMLVVIRAFGHVRSRRPRAAPRSGSTSRRGRSPSPPPA